MKGHDFSRAEKLHNNSGLQPLRDVFQEAMMEYKGYAAGPIDFDPEDKTFSGTVAGLRDVIHFEGRTATELERAFRESMTAIWIYARRPASSPTYLLAARSSSAPSRSCTAKQSCARQSRV